MDIQYRQQWTWMHTVCSACSFHNDVMLIIMCSGKGPLTPVGLVVCFQVTGLKRFVSHRGHSTDTPWSTSGRTPPPGSAWVVSGTCDGSIENKWAPLLLEICHHGNNGCSVLANCSTNTHTHTHMHTRTRPFITRSLFFSCFLQPYPLLLPSHT